MPNWVKTKINVSGNQKDISAFYKQIILKSRKDYDKDFSFNTIIEMPKSLTEVIVSGNTDRAISAINGDKVAITFMEQLKTERKESYEQAIKSAQLTIENQKLYGFGNWYEWSRANWDTKWDSARSNVTVVDNTNLVIELETAWSCAYNVYLNMAKQYPSLDFTVEYADESLGYNCGTIIFENGNCLSDEDGDLAFARRIWGYVDNDDEDAQFYMDECYMPC